MYCLPFRNTHILKGFTRYTRSISESVELRLEYVKQLREHLRNEEIPEALKVYDQMKSIGIYPTDSLLHRLGKKIGKNKQTLKANELLEDIKNDPIIYYSLIDGFCMAKELPTAINIYKRLKDKNFSISYDEFSDRDTEEEEEEFAEEKEEFVEIPREKPDFQISRAIESLIICSCKINNLDTTLKLFSESKEMNLKLHDGIYNSILRILFRYKKYDLIIETYNYLIEKLTFIPNRTTINILFQVYKEQNKNEKIFELLQDIRKYSIILDTKVLQEILKIALEQEKPNYILEALEVVNKNTISSYNDKYSNVIDSFNIIIFANCSINNIQSAIQTFREMKKQNIRPNCLTFQHLIEGSRKIKNFDLALQLYDQMIKLNIQPNAIIFSRIIEIYCIQNQLENAENIFDHFSCSGLPISIITYNILIRSFCRHGDINKALHYVNNMKENGIQPNISTINNLIEGYCLFGTMEEALLYLENENNRGVEPNFTTFEIIISSCINKPNRLKFAIKLFNEFYNKTGLQPNSALYNSIISVCSSVKSYKLAVSFWNEAKQNNQHLDINLYNTIISVYCSYYGIDKAQELIEEMKLNQIEPNTKTYIPFIEEAKKLNNDVLYKNFKRQADLVPN